MNLRKTTLIAIAVAGLTGATSASAEPWCNGGTVVNVADIQWDHADLLYHTQGIQVPPHAVDYADYYLAWTAASNYCSSFSGGAGPNWFNVPGHGSVSFVPYEPSYLSHYPGSHFDYDLSEGISFQCNKCYAIPPLPVSRVEPFLFDLGGKRR